MSIETVIRKPLHQNWILEGPKGESLAATVPGTVQSDLLRHKLIPDPHVGLNEKEVLWVEERDWTYQTRFDLPKSSGDRNWSLHFYGLDTIAQIRLNGKLLGAVDNMFRTHVFSLESAREKDNLLEVKFLSPTKHALALEKKLGTLKQANPGFDARQHLRKAACSYGWDWGIRLGVSGIWRDVILEGRKKTAFISDWSLETVSIQPQKSSSTSNGKAVLEFIGTVSFPGKASASKKSSSATSDLEWVLEGVCGNSRFQTVIPVKSSPTKTRLSIAEAIYWMPRGYGNPALYQVTLSLRKKSDQTILDSKEFRLGIRRIEVEQKKDKAGKSFRILVNGIPVWAKGANWIPVDSIIPRNHNERTAQLIDLACEANMNILRVWGGGVYESDFFYDLCDEKGLLVWQDFAFACGFYPETPEYQKNFIREAEDNIRRLRHHASLAMWCGNNEIDWGFHEWGSFRAAKPHKPFSGGIFWHKLAPKALKSLDPNRFYWPSSPFGSGHPNGEHDGDVHWWKIWQEQDYNSFRKCRGRFVSEFGLQAMPAAETFKKYLSPDQLWPQSREVEAHQKHPAGQIGQVRQVAEHFRIREDFIPFTHTSQVFQGEGVKLAVEHWRSLKWHCAGAIYWQINDVWPVVSWASIDSEMKPKALHFYAGRFFQPVLVLFQVEEDQVKVVVVNDSLESFEVDGSLRAMNFSGAEHHHENKKIKVPANGRVELFSFKTKALIKKDPLSELVVAEIRRDGKLVSRNIHFHDRFKFLNFPKPTLKITARTGGLEIESDVFAKSVWLHSQFNELPLMDNYVDLLPGEKRFIPQRDGQTLPEAGQIHGFCLE